MIKEFLGLLWIAVVCTGVYMGFLLVKEIRKQHRPSTSRRTAQVPRSTVSRDVQNRLLNMVSGDMAVASRLLQLARSSHPNKPEQWIWEKAIFDLERDRR